MLVIRTGGQSGVMLFREAGVAYLKLEPKRLTPDLEAKLRTLEWDSSPKKPTSSVRAPAPSPSPSPQPGKSSLRDSSATLRARPRTTPTAGVPALVPSLGKKADADKGSSIPSSGQSGRASSSLDPPSNRNAGTSSSSAGDAVFAGDLEVLSVPDVLEFCRNGKRTGTLVICSGEQTSTMKVHRGLIGLAVSPRSNVVSMLARLKSAGKLTEEQVLAFSQANEDPSLVARRLVEARLIDEAAARDLVMAQVQDALAETLGYVEGRFAYHPKAEEPAGTELGMLVDPQVVLLRILAERDEATR